MRVSVADIAPTVYVDPSEASEARKAHAYGASAPAPRCAVTRRGRCCCAQETDILITRIYNNS